MTIQQAKDWLEYSPKEPGRIASGLLGWVFTDDSGLKQRMCSCCAGRLAGRGIRVPMNATAIWQDGASGGWGGCDICGRQS